LYGRVHVSNYTFGRRSAYPILARIEAQKLPNGGFDLALIGVAAAEHYDLAYADGRADCRFLGVADARPGATETSSYVAVHCR
jgi:hypothetical protein